jgi:hypothetical protein
VFYTNGRDDPTPARVRICLSCLWRHREGEAEEPVSFCIALPHSTLILHRIHWRSLGSHDAALARYSKDVERVCKLAQADIQNCGCAIHFLQNHLGPKQALLLLKVWAAGEGHLGDPSRAFATIYREHGEASVLETSVEFLKIRMEFQGECNPSAFLEEQQLMTMDSWSDFFTQ